MYIALIFHCLYRENLAVHCINFSIQQPSIRTHSLLVNYAFSQPCSIIASKLSTDVKCRAFHFMLNCPAEIIYLFCVDTMNTLHLTIEKSYKPHCSSSWLRKRYLCNSYYFLKQSGKYKKEYNRRTPSCIWRDFKTIAYNWSAIHSMIQRYVKLWNLRIKLFFVREFHFSVNRHKSDAPN